MELNLHANATTTPKTRSYIQRSKKSVAQLAAELGVSETTIRRWRGRDDCSRTARIGRTTWRPACRRSKRALVCELRTSLQLPLDDIVEVMQRCINAKLSRSAIHRCLQRQWHQPACQAGQAEGRGLRDRQRRLHPYRSEASAGACSGAQSYAFVAIDRATRYVYVEIHSRRDGETAAGFPQALPGPLPARCSHHPDRQRRRVHRPLRRRQEEQAARTAFR